MIAVVRRGSTLALLALVAPLVVACRTESPGVGTAVVRDSAGVRIVENPAPAPGAAPFARLSEVPTLTIGDEPDAADPLFRVQGVRRAANGDIVVANAGSAQVRRYDGGGALRWTAGAKGGGPGEFESLAWIATLAGDSVLAFDSRARRFAVFDGAGTFVRSFRAQDEGGQPALVRPLGVLADGAVLVGVSSLGSLVGTGGMPPAGLMRDTLRLLRLDRNGALSDTLARVPGDERVLHVSATSIEIVTPPFAPRLVVAAAGAGMAAPLGEGHQLARWSVDGTLQRLVRLAGVERAVTPADLDAHIARLTSGVDDAQRRQSLEQGMRALSLPERMPAVGRLLIDAHDRLWAMDFLAPADSTATWRVFDADGRYLGAVAMPRTFTVHEVGPDWVLGVFRDEDDLEQVRVYGIERDE